MLDMTACIDCETGVCERQIVVHKFPYGSGETAVELEATIPVYVCNSCGAGYYDYEAEEILDAVVTNPHTEPRREP
jgi:hypothetical protein